MRITKYMLPQTLTAREQYRILKAEGYCTKPLHSDSLFRFPLIIPLFQRRKEKEALLPEDSKA